VSDDVVRIVGPHPEDWCSVSPTRGAAILHLTSDGVELMDRGHPPASSLSRQSDFLDTGLTGWVDCFPSISPEAVENGGSTHAVPDHGELWWRTWEITDRTEHGVSLQVDVPESRAMAKRSIEWSGRTLTVRTEITSQSTDPIPFVLASHPLFAVWDDLWVDIPNDVLRWESSSGWGQDEPDLDGLWPQGPDRVRHWPVRGNPGCAKVFLPWPQGGVHFGRAGRAWSYDWTDRPEGANLGLWLNQGAIPAGRPLEHWAPEPTVGSADSLSACVEQGLAGLLPTGGRTMMTVVLSLRNP
jgi:hypothetical protein